MLHRKRRAPVGARPGTLVFDERSPHPRIRAIMYDADEVREREVVDVATLAQLIDGPGFAWIDVCGLGDRETIEALGRIFSIHPLALEDLVHVPVRPKVEGYDQNLLIITRMLRLAGEMTIDSEQVSIVVGRTWVVTFQEREGDVLDPVRARLRAGNHRIRKGGPGYLAYAILDTIVDAYFPVLEHVSDRLDQLESDVMREASPTVLHRLNSNKRVLLQLRRAIGPQREATNRLIRDPSPFVNDETRLHLRDTYDHCLVCNEAIETSREFLNGLMNTHLSVVSNRMNETMKTLTVVASIFVPLTFIAGIYGMNFEWMPELGWRWGYPALLFVMALLSAAMLVAFRTRGWLGGAADAAGPDDD